MVDGDEYDFFSNWRHYISHTRQHLKWVKRKYNKRARKHAKEVISEQRESADCSMD